jgi:hypothetical protein
VGAWISEEDFDEANSNRIHAATPTGFLIWRSVNQPHHFRIQSLILNAVLPFA